MSFKFLSPSKTRAQTSLHARPDKLGWNPGLKKNQLATTCSWGAVGVSSTVALNSEPNKEIHSPSGTMEISKWHALLFFQVFQGHFWPPCAFFQPPYNYSHVRRRKLRKCCNNLIQPAEPRILLLKPQPSQLHEQHPARFYFLSSLSKMWLRGSPQERYISFRPKLSLRNARSTKVFSALGRGS